MYKEGQGQRAWNFCLRAGPEGMKLLFQGRARGHETFVSGQGQRAWNFCFRAESEGMNFCFRAGPEGTLKSDLIWPKSDIWILQGMEVLLRGPYRLHKMPLSLHVSSAQGSKYLQNTKVLGQVFTRENNDWEHVKWWRRRARTVHLGLTSTHVGLLPWWKS